MPFQKGNTLRLGIRTSEETKRKIGKANKGKFPSNKSTPVVNGSLEDVFSFLFGFWGE